MRIHSLRNRADAAPLLDAAPLRAQLRALETDTAHAAMLGETLVQRGLLTLEQAELIARTQRNSGARFGDTAIAMGLADREAIDAALASQFKFAVIDRASQRFDAALVTARGTQDRASELIRGLRTRLWQALTPSIDSREVPVLTIASMTGAVGRRVIAGNLAIAFAQAGTRTLLIDADMRDPALHQLFKAPIKAGLSSFLAGRHPQPELLHFDEIEGLSFCSAGPVPPNPAELLTRLPAALPRLAAAAGAQLVLVNAPPFDASDDGFLIAAAAPRVLMVTRRHFTRAATLQATAKRLHDANIEVIGSVLNVA